MQILLFQRVSRGRMRLGGIRMGYYLRLETWLVGWLIGAQELEFVDHGAFGI